MKTYQCHKKVKAAKIVGITEEAECHILHLDGEKMSIAISFNDPWLTRNPKLAVGGYFVQYEDGYTAYSPAEPFESGYTEVTDAPV